MRRLKHILEWLGVLLLLGIAKAMPLDMASAFFGWIASLVGPHLKASGVARHNLAKYLPDVGKAEHQRIIRAMWNNIGRLAGEMPHWNKISNQELLHRVQILNIPAQGTGKGMLLVSGHYGNWELYPHILRALNIPNYVVYRPANNIYVDRLINKLRSPKSTTLIQKGAAGVRQILSVLQNNGTVGMLIDQRVSDGVAIPFLGHPAKTVTAPGAIACKLGSSMVMSRIRRTRGAHFTVEVVNIVVDPQDNAITVMQKINQQLESWVRQEPEQWFWLHKRWGYTKSMK